MENRNAFSLFLKKWKKQSKPLRIALLIVDILYIVGLVLFTKAILSLVNIESGMRVLILLIFYVHLAIITLLGVVYLYTNKKKRLIFLMVLSTIYSCIFGVSFYFISRTIGIIDNVQKKYMTYTSVMISMKDTEKYNKIGMINNEADAAGYIIPKLMIKEYDIKGEIVYYDDYVPMITDLYDGEIDALFISNTYWAMFDSYERFENIENDVKEVYSMSKELENSDNVQYSTKKLTEPFTMLLMGVDSTGDGIASADSFNGDSLMLITFNPKTLNATVFSIPRDTYVPITCRSNIENKINSSAYGGTSCVVKTIENLTGIEIDYYMKVNFTGVVKLVDDLGGITVDVPISFCEQDSERRFGEYEICINAGLQKLNGEAALAFARHRKTLPLGDFQRVQHQQMIVEAMVSELKNISSIDDFYKIIDDVANNIDTNMTRSQILSLYNVGKDLLINMLKDGQSLTIEKTYLSGYDLTMYIDSYRSYIYTFQYYRKSLEDIVSLMKINLELEKPTPIKTFSFDINEEYTSHVTGKGAYSEKHRELLPNFVGKTKAEVQKWADERDISVTFTEQESSSPDDEVIEQNEHAGKLVEDVKDLKITVSKYDKTKETTPKENPDEKEDEDDGLLPDFTGWTIQEFNKWKNSLKGINMIIDTELLTVDDLLTIDEDDLKENTIYKQSVPSKTKLDKVSTLTVYYYTSE